MPFGIEKKLEQLGYRKTVKILEDIFIRFDKLHERDIHTNGRTDRQTPYNDIGRACIASRDNTRT